MVDGAFGQDGERLRVDDEQLRHFGRQSLGWGRACRGWELNQITPAHLLVSLITEPRRGSSGC
jgi:hypothetical protein